MAQHKELFATINPIILTEEEKSELEFRQLVGRTEANSELIKLCNDNVAHNDYIINKILKTDFNFETLSALLKIPKSKNIQEIILKNLADKAGNDLSKIFFVLLNTEPNSTIRRLVRYSFSREAMVKKEKTPKDWEVLYIYYLPNQSDESYVLGKIAEMSPKERNLIIDNIFAFNDWESIFMGSDGLLLALEKILKIYQKKLPEIQVKSLIGQKIRQTELSFEGLTKMAEEANSGLKEALLKVASDYAKTPEQRKIISVLKRAP